MAHAAFEAVYHSPDTALLRRHSIQAQYSDDPELNAILVVAVTVVSTMVGGLAGLVARFLVGKTEGQWFRPRNRLPRRRIREVRSRPR